MFLALQSNYIPSNALSQEVIESLVVNVGRPELHSQPFLFNGVREPPVGEPVTVVCPVDVLLADK